MNERGEFGGAVRNRAEAAGVLLIKHACHKLCVADQVREFVLDVAVVDVDGNCSNFETPQHGFEPLVGVLSVNSNMVIFDHTASC
ncbi:unannotated protein [freshwater metagenome]|uniref:Unannotated protein n=1 Tax=freshwater metagenome TaxID=449393 RepID=A0A6J6BAB2_9ZZZZ